jgi:hypothetical protein
VVGSALQGRDWSLSTIDIKGKIKKRTYKGSGS